MNEQLLDGLTVLITRPHAQSEQLQEAVIANGGSALVFPVMEIVSRPETEIRRDLDKLPAADITIFVSQNAVEHGLRFASGKLAAIGPTTAAAIEASGRIVDIGSSSGFDSEHLLAEPLFKDVASKSIRIIRGDGGRELLADTLRERGADVHYLSTYERRCPQRDPEALADLEKRWREDGVDAIVVMSVNSLHNLRDILPDWCRQQLRQTPLVSPATRVLKDALDLHPACPTVLANGPQMKDIIEAIAVSGGTLSDTDPTPGTS